MNRRLLISAVCGGVFGLVSAVTTAKIVVLGVTDNFDPFDLWFSQIWSDLLLLALVPTAVLGCAAFFAFLYAVGFARVSTFVGIAGGALFGFFVSPPDSVLPNFNVVKAIVLVLWEWFMGGIGGIVGSFIARRSRHLD